MIYVKHCVEAVLKNILYLLYKGKTKTKRCKKCNIVYKETIYYENLTNLIEEGHKNNLYIFKHQFYRVNCNL